MNDQVRLFNEDCVTGARKYLTDNSVDLIITDPPYGINGEKLDKHYNRKESFVVDGYTEIPEEKYGKFSKDWICEAERVLRPGGSLYIVSGYTNLFYILSALRETSLIEINHIIWKYNFGVYTSRKYISSHYHILFYEKPGKHDRVFNLESRFGSDERTDSGGSLNYLDREDVWSINREYKPGQVKNKNELPTALLKKMIQYSSNEGDLVCDFFLGGCSTARVATGLSRRVVGFEISEQIFKVRSPEIYELTPGFLMDTLNAPVIREKRGRHHWTEAELLEVREKCLVLKAEGKMKKEIIALLMEEYDSGRFAIMGAIKKAGGWD